MLISFIICYLSLLLADQMLKRLKLKIYTKKTRFDLRQFELHNQLVNVVKYVQLLIVVVRNFEYRFHIVEFVDEHDLVRLEPIEITTSYSCARPCLFLKLPRFDAVLVTRAAVKT